jgi:TetR/AcrR family transcriptional regulator, regulator of cefoperazone and chloramphenicol sensitivity
VRSTGSDDLTTRARIRDAAIALFGRDGFDRTSIRAVAQAAGVSAALVIHHFGSKDALRAACDAYIVEDFVGRKGDLTGTRPRMAAKIQGWLADVEKFRPQIDYLAQMLAADNAAADALFDALLEGTTEMLREQTAAGVVRPGSDPQITALYVTAYGVMPLLLQRQLARAVGDDHITAEFLRRSTLPILELYTHGLYTDDRFLEAARDALGRTTGPSSGKGDNDPIQDPDPPQPSAS